MKLTLITAFMLALIGTAFAAGGRARFCALIRRRRGGFGRGRLRQPLRCGRGRACGPAGNATAAAGILGDRPEGTFNLADDLHWAHGDAVLELEVNDSDLHH